MHNVRFKCGSQLAREAKVEADIVSTVPDSATPAALGYSLAVKLNLTKIITVFIFQIILN